jgi:ribosome-associated toxin RatA of RatAB toxin-antitoxin module
MIYRAEHELTIATGLKECIELCVNVEAWPRFMSAVRNAKRAELLPDGSEVIEITAEMGRETTTWRSKRILDYANGWIAFSRIDPIHPILRMDGQWNFTAKEEGKTCVRLRHEYELTGISSAPQIAAAISSNASRDLWGMKTYLEQTHV